MKVKALKSGLQKLVPVLEDWEAKRVVQDFEKLIELMDGHEDMTVDAFCKKARTGLEGKSGATSKRSSGGASGLRQAVVDGHVQALKASGNSEADFTTALQSVGTDKQVRLKELKAIAQGFMGLAPMTSKKQDLLNEIKTKWAQDLRTAHKFKILSQW